MSSLIYKKQNLLTSDCQYIAHQTNIKSFYARGLAEQIFKKFEYSNIYKNGSKRIPGDIIISGNGNNERFIINLNGQVHPGPPGKINDGWNEREKYFQSGLNKILKIDNLISIAFPNMIGCGLAQGNWKNYLYMLEDFAQKAKINNNTDTFIYIND